MKADFATCVLVVVLGACTSSSSEVSSPAVPADGGSSDSGAAKDATLDATEQTPVDAATSGDSCAAATTGLAQTADPGAPVLDPTSFLQRVDSNDAFCASRSNGQLATFGPYGYQLTLRFSDAENDGPSTLDEVQAAGVVRLASDPDMGITTRTDPKRWSTGGGIIIQLCLDKVYAVNELAVGFDIADKAGHRSKAICIRQQSGG